MDPNSPKKFRSTFHLSIRLWTSTFHFVRIIAFVLDFALILCWVTFCLKRPNKKEFRLIGIFRQKCEKICARRRKSLQYCSQRRCCFIEKLAYAHLHTQWAACVQQHLKHKAKNCPFIDILPLKLTLLVRREQRQTLLDILDFYPEGFF